MRRRDGGGLLGGGGDQGGDGPERYKMREKLLSFGDDFWIEDERGRRAYFVDGKAVRVRQTLVFKDADRRQELATHHQGEARQHPRYDGNRA